MRTLVDKSNALLRLLRPELPISAGVCVVVGQAIGLGALPALPVMALGFCLGFFLSGSAMVFNDYFDLEVDRINTPHRPLPAGLLSQREAAVFGGVLAVTALLIALSIHPTAFALSLITWVLGFLYNWKLKAAGLWGNLIVSSSVGMTLIMGGVSVGQAANPNVWLFALIAFSFDLAEEIAGDAMDMAGDQQRASRSLAIVYGKKTALRISAVLFALVILLTLVPLLWRERSLSYWVPIGLMDVLIVFFALRLYRSQTPTQGRAWMRRLYLSATIGLAAFIASSFLR